MTEMGSGQGSSKPESYLIPESPAINQEKTNESQGTVTGTDGIDGINRIRNQRVKKAQEAQRIINPLPKRLYSLPEAGHYLGRTLWSVRELVWSGKLPIVRSGKRIFVDVNDLNTYIEKNKRTYV